MHTPPINTPAPHAPQSHTELFVAFSLLALQGFGGVMAVVQRELVENKRWLTREQFIEDWAVAQILPGPNVVNLSLMLGGRHFGISGALTALAGILALPLVLVLLLSTVFNSIAHLPAAQGALRGMGAVAAGLILATGLKLVPALTNNRMGRPVCAALVCATFVAIAWLRWPLLYVLLGLGSAACVWAWWCLGRQALPRP